MAEYIKIEKKTFPTFYKRNLNDYGKGWNACLKSVLQHKIADVVEVKHGKWIDTDSFDAHYQPIYQCSVCHKEVADEFISCHKYCLHCGAKMQK